MPKQFNASEVKARKKYIIKDFLALGTMTNIISQAGVGKTYLAIQLAVDVALGRKFLGMDVGQMKVLLVDQDQSADETELRCKRFMNFYGVETHPNFMLSCDEFLQLKDGTLEQAILASEANLTVIDSLTSVCSELDMNSPTNMQKLKDLYTHVIDESRSVVFLHHMSEHKEFSFADAMTCNPSSLSLYSSVINGTLDGYYILFNQFKGKHLKELIIRPIIKRFNIKTGIIKTGLDQTDDTLHFKDMEKLDIDETELATHDELAILNLFVETLDVKPFYFVNDIFESLQGLKSINDLRTILSSMLNKKLVQMKATRHNKFSFSITDKGIEMAKSEYNKMPEIVIEGDPIFELSQTES